MSKSEAITPMHWALFHSLESDLVNLSRYVEINVDNSSAYSVELTRMLLAIGAEVDSVAKELCIKRDPNSNPKNIKDYEKIIPKHIPDISKIEVRFSRYNQKKTPWDSWKNSTVPTWWQDHNSVKHDRASNFHKANLENVLSGLAGLFCLCFYLYEDDFGKGMVTPNANILYFDEPFQYALMVNDRGPTTTSIKAS